LPSYLEVEFETHYLKFVMPTIRGSESGSKKRYAGMVRAADNSEKIVFKGLEAVRTDWTPLAREFQRTLYRMVFNDEPVDDYIRETAAALQSGALDDKLVYRKRLRRKLNEYTRNVPPHVQAARKQAKPGRWVSYLITVNGPEPSDECVSGIDYQHYLEKQLEPVADGILHFLDTSFERINGAQISLF
jgi:DNA polymerase-2